MKWIYLAVYTVLVITNLSIKTVIAIIITTTGEYDGCWTREVMTNQCGGVFILL